MIGDDEEVVNVDGPNSLQHLDRRHHTRDPAVQRVPDADHHVEGALCHVGTVGNVPLHLALVGGLGPVDEAGRRLVLRDVGVVEGVLDPADVA